MLLASQHKPKGLFGAYAPSGADMTPMADPAQLMQRNMALGSVQQAMQPKKPGINWLGVLADALAGAAGREGPYAASMMAQRQQQQQAQLAQQQRIQGLQDWQWKSDYAREHEKPKVGSFEWYQTANEADRRQYDIYNPIIIDGPDGRYIVPRSAYSGQQQQQFDPNEWEDVGGVGGNTGGMFPVTSNKLDNITVQSESAGNPNARSPKGAMGLWQVMPGTARDPGFGISPWNGSPSDLNRVGAEYRRAMEKRYKGNLPKMWAAYNWGPGAVDRAIAKYGDNWLNYAPAETRAYVARNMRAVRGGK